MEVLTATSVNAFSALMGVVETGIQPDNEKMLNLLIDPNLHKLAKDRPAAIKALKTC